MSDAGRGLRAGVLDVTLLYFVPKVISYILLVLYYDAESSYSVCQLLEWTTHKAACVSPLIGTWHAYDLSNGNPTLVPAGSRFPPNVHGDRPFVVKLQTGANRDLMGGHSLQISDRKESFLLYFEDDQSMLEPRLNLTDQSVEGTIAVQFYRWALRTSDEELKVCIDVPPSNAILW